MDEIDLALHMESGEHDNLDPTTPCVECLKYQALQRERDARHVQWRLDNGE